MKKVLILYFIAMTAFILYSTEVFGISVGSRPLVKSVQYVSGTIVAGEAGKNETITAVNLNSTIVLSMGSEGADDDPTVLTRVWLADSTTVTLNKGGTTSNTVDAKAVVIEFEPGSIKSFQTGYVTIINTAASGNAAITTAVDTDRAIVFWQGNANAAANTVNDVAITLELTSAVLLTATRIGTAGEAKVGYSVVEFHEWVGP